MTVRRIVVDIAADTPEEMQTFYKDLFDLDVAMALGWITTMTSTQSRPAQISFMSEGGSGAPVPDMSIEVDNVDQRRTTLPEGCVPRATTSRFRQSHVR